MTQAQKTVQRAGYSLIEVLIALVLLMLLVQVIGTSLVTVLSVEKQAAEIRLLCDHTQLLATDTLLGIDEEKTVQEWIDERWKPAHKLVKVGNAAKSVQWHEWSLTEATQRNSRLQIYVMKRESRGARAK